MAISVDESELLSAFIDGELKGGELDLVLNLIATNPEVRKRVHRYQLSSDILHEHVVTKPNFDFAARLESSLADEPVHHLDDEAGRPTAQIIPLKQTFWKQAGGLALAASISAVAVVGVMTNSQTQLVIPVADSGADIQQLAINSGQRWTVGEPEVTEQLNTYLVDHNEQAGANGVFSYARVVSHGSD